MLIEGNQIHNFISSTNAGTVINYRSGSDILTTYGSGSSSTGQKVTVPVPEKILFSYEKNAYISDRYRYSSTTKNKRV